MTSPSPPQPINAGFFTKLRVRFLYKFLSQRWINKWRKNPQSIVMVSSKLCIKSTAFTRLAEAHTMRFISENTSIPVPRVHAAFEHNGKTYILMDRIEGNMVYEGWVRRPEESKAVILRQLSAITQQLRNIPPPDGVGVADITGGPIYDQRLPDKPLWGPFSTIDDFHRDLCKGHETKHLPENHESKLPGLAELFKFHNEPWPKSTFTHGDLSSFNILVRCDEVVAIIDWETAGWMPPYWEYTMAWHVNPFNEFWQDEIDKFITPDARALEMDIIRRRHYGEF